MWCVTQKNEPKNESRKKNRKLRERERGASLLCYVVERQELVNTHCFAIHSDGGENDDQSYYDDEDDAGCTTSVFFYSHLLDAHSILPEVLMEIWEHTHLT